MYMLKWPRLLDMLTNRYTHTTYTNFCSFTVSNPSNHIRKLYADTLSTYKQVDGYGKVCNTSNALDSLNGYWRESKLEYFQEHPHKFSLVMENSSNVGYTTEKLMDSFLSRSIPIYWGDPLVTQWFNPNAFINIPDHNWIDYVKQLDQDEELFNKKMNEPIFTTSQLHKLQLNLHNFEGWLLNQL